MTPSVSTIFAWHGTASPRARGLLDCDKFVAGSRIAGSSISLYVFTNDAAKYSASLRIPPHRGAAMLMVHEARRFGSVKNFVQIQFFHSGDIHFGAITSFVSSGFRAHTS